MNAESDEERTGPAPWPQHGDMLFKVGADWLNNACLNFGAEGWDLYATGYKEAADALADRVMETHRQQDTLIYPITFLYRHYVELRLKEIISNGNELLNNSSSMAHVHPLDDLWRSVRAIFEAVWPGDESEALKAMDVFMKQFCEVDRSSMSFRYPVMKDGRPSLDLKHVNIRNLKAVMANVAALLDGASIGIADLLNQAYRQRNG